MNDTLAPSPCTFSCSGDTTESCGGDGGYGSMYADVSKFNINAFYAQVAALASSSTSTSSTATGTATGTLPTTSSTGSPLNPNQPATVQGTTAWNYVGCWKDNVGNVRSLVDKNTASDLMSLESCAQYCAGFNFFGTEYGRECYCGYRLDTALRTAEVDCATPCINGPGQLCGGGARLSVFNNTIYTAPPALPSHVARSGNYSWLGCYTEATTGKALPVNTANDNMSVDTCAAYCNTKGYKYAGLEYSRECYCGNALAAGANLTATTECKGLCKGKSP